MNAEITFRTQTYLNPNANPAPTAANIELLKQAIYRLSSDPKLANHPIRRYLNDPKLKAEIIFDNPRANGGAEADDKQIYISSSRDLPYYLEMLIHEFIHTDMSSKYVSSIFHYSFLKPEDFAFRNLMEEAFANAIEAWGRFIYPEFPHNLQIRNWQQQSAKRNIADALKSDLKATTNLSDEQINARVAAEIFNTLMTKPTTYTLETIPNNMDEAYKQLNTFLIPEYAFYSSRGDALLRHMWNHLASMMPFELPRDKNFDYYRARFKSDVADWARYASSPEESIQYWLNYDYRNNALKKLNAQNLVDQRYDYLSREDEEKLNKVMKEIDPYFIPVNTANDEWRIWQERQPKR